MFMSVTTAKDLIHIRPPQVLVAFEFKQHKCRPTKNKFAVRRGKSIIFAIIRLC